MAAGLDALSCPAPDVIQLCQPNADCDRSELLECIEDRLSCDLSASTVVAVIPFTMSGLDHYTMRANLRRVFFPNGYEVCKSVYFVEPPCVLLAHGLVTGVVCSIGFGETFIVPVSKGRVLSDGVLRSNLGGMALTQYMQHLLLQEAEENEDVEWERLQDNVGLPFITFCRNLKEKYCHVLPSRDANVAAPCNHSIPGVGVEIRTACHECPELLFQGEAGLGSMVWEAVQRASEGNTELQDALLSSIVLNGGSAQMPGLAERLRYEVTLQMPHESDTSIVHVLGERGDNAPWQGAVRFALANNCIRQRTSIPQCLLMHQCAAQDCTAHETADGDALKICSGCKKVRYCSLEHQKAHWKEHKKECVKCAQ